MDDSFQISVADWQRFLTTCMKEYGIYAPLHQYGSLDYKLITAEDIPEIVYNVPRPVSPLKIFFLPVKENVTLEQKSDIQTLIIGVPSCDLESLGLLDEIYLNENFPDSYYRQKRENALIIGTDCLHAAEHCHCNVYTVEPVPEKYFDIRLAVLKDHVFLFSGSHKGSLFLQKISASANTSTISSEQHELLRAKQQVIRNLLTDQNKDIPRLNETLKQVKEPGSALWEKYAADCVSCGACATICPTCTCFLLLDRPEFEKIRQTDACQYPGFARVSAGEDPLHKKYVRFRNRYLCKYVWKPETFHSPACTGCGRCIESCIGNIDKNRLLTELGKHTSP